MRIQISAVMTALVLGSLFSACSKEEPAAPAKAGSGSVVASDVAAAKAEAGTANGRCPVQTELLVASDAATRTYKDPATGTEQKIGFCCEKCPKQFDKDPEKYMAKLPQFAKEDAKDAKK